MIDLKTCRLCPHCEAWESSQESETGEIAVLPSVTCGIMGDVLLMNCAPPEDCPYKMEHKLSTQNVPVAFANQLSGCES